MFNKQSLTHGDDSNGEEYVPNKYFRTMTSTPEEHICSQSGKTYKYRRNLTTHERTHNGTEAFTCCGTGFPSRRRLQRHRCIVHGDTKNHVCLTCGKLFSTKDDLSQHEASERGKHLSCDVCGHKTSRMAELREHMARHSEERKHVCRECGASYKHLSSLSRHTAEKHNKT